MGSGTVYKLGEITDFTNGGAWSVDAYAPNGIPVVRVSDIQDGIIDLKDCKYLSEHLLDKYKEQILSEGDLIICTVGSHPTQPGSVVGRPGIVSRQVAGAVLNQNAVRISPKVDFVDKKWLGYIGKSQEFRNYIISCARGAANQVRMSIGLLKEMPIHVPPLPIQRRIANILSAYDDLIENNTRRILILEQMARALYQEWFGNLDKDSLPVGMEKIRYSDLLESYTGGDWGEEQPDEKENRPAIIIRGTDFPEVKNGSPLRAPTRYISKTSLEKRGLRMGDIVVENSVNASSRCIGTALLITKSVLQRIDGDAICASFCKNFRLKDPSFAPLVYLHMRFLYEENLMPFYQNVAANGIGNFQAERFVNSEYIFVPKDKAKLKEILETLSNLTSSTYADQIANLRQTRDLLLPRLVSGEIELQ